MNARSPAVSQGRLLSLSFKVDDVPPRGLSGTLTAGAEELAALARDLDLADIASLKMDYELIPIGARRFRLTGRVNAQVTQSCVVTLEPVESTIDEPIDLELWPKEDVEKTEYAEDEEGAALALEGPEPIMNDRIEIGQLAYEHFTTALDPYPRKAGVEFEWRDPRTDEGSESGTRPFAELGSLLQKKGNTAR